MFRLETLGGLALTNEAAGAVTTQRRRLALLALLAVAGERGLTRDKLVAYLWPDSPSDNARHALEQLLYELRRQLGESFLLGPDPLRLNSGIISSDIAEFRNAVASGTPGDAVALYRGPFLDGFYLSDAAEFERWAEGERSQLAGKYAWALQCLADASRDQKDYAAEIGWRRRLVATDPLNGGLALSLMRALASAGDASGALQYARVYETLMREELDSVPDPPVNAFVHELRTAQASAAAADQSASLGAGVAASADPPVQSGAAVEARERTPPRRIVAALAALVTVLTLGVVAFVREPHRSVNEPVDARLVAVFPFRVVGADPAVGYLREGMVDLLTVKLNGEGGPRALDPRAVLGAWRRALRSTAEDLSPDAAVVVARRLGAGRLVDGAVVGSPSHLMLTAAVVDVPSGITRARASVAGTADSLPALIDRLTAAILAGESGRTELATLTSLPALRAYLDGQSAMRAGRFMDAFQNFNHALQLDSTFALAGIGLGRASFWDGGDDSGRGFRVAWAVRNRLSPRDLAIIAPWMVPGAEHLATAERAVVTIPESPEAWYELGDDYFHGGALAGMDAPLGQAAAAFRRALELDSSFAEPRMHLFEIAAAEGDTAEVRRFGNLVMAADSTNDFAGYVRWQMAVALQDTAGLVALRARFDRMNEISLVQLVMRSQTIGIAQDDARRAVAALLRRADTKAARGHALREQYVLAMNGGRPREGLAAATERERSYDNVPPARITDALYWDGDSAAAEAEVRLRARRTRVLASGAEDRRAQYDDICLVQQWRLAHGDLGMVPAAIARLRAAVVPGPPAADTAAAANCATLLEAWLATTARQPYATVLVARLDSLSRRNWEWTFNLAVVRLLEAQGNLPAALAAVRRRPYSFAPLYLSTYLREEGHLAALVGDTVGAIKAYRRYLALRFDPEPPLRAQRDSVSAELSRLGGEH
jgi:eukaryotic-like serine/threonine-protein kinase